MTMITLDLDHMKENKIRAIAQAIKCAYGSTNPTVMYRISSSGRGGHILAYINEELEENFTYWMRYLLGDHPRRICIDYNRGRNGNPNFPQQVLFDEKIKKGKVLRAGPWRNV